MANRQKHGLGHGGFSGHRVRVYMVGANPSGRLWSRSVTQKDGHYIVDTGPYGLVRHPIYTGISLATIATGIMRGTALAFAGAFLLIFSFYIKARLEEQFLRAQLGPTNYDAYKRRVPMLIPFLRLP